MDGTWHLHHREIKYGICPICKKLVPRKGLIKKGKSLICFSCDNGE